ncbi:MAG: cyanophycinase [Rhodospirillales bacterium]
MLLTVAAGAAQAGELVTKGEGWLYWRRGNTADVQTATQPGVLFEGGGTDVNAAYRWMCAKSGNGDFLVIRASGDADYNPYIQRLCPAENSVATLKIINRRGGLDPAVQAIILQAEALFIAGGNQANYVNFWQNTPVQGAINALAARGVPVGGTSAGNAILAQFAFSALINTIYSKQALADCFDRRITIDNGFLNLSPLLAGIITDDHFAPRHRMGRLVTFLARIVESGEAHQASGIALNENTAFLMEPDGQGQVVGSGAAYFLRTPGPPEVCAPATPVTYTGIPVFRVAPGGTFDLASWTGPKGTAYTVSATAGVLTSTQKGGKIY